jgi:hypothetical protein
MLLFNMADTEIQTVETTTAHVADTLARLGISPDRPLTIVIEPDDWLTKARRESRRRVLAAGLSDEDLDRLIEKARDEVQRAP